jgi:hypothetical protein
MGLVVLLAVGPRYRQRQPQLERQFYARQMGGQSVMGDQGPTTARPGSLLIPLKPLLAVMLSIAAVCWTMVLLPRLGLRSPICSPDPADLPEKVRGP